MVSHRDGSEINLLDSSIRTTGGALFSTTVYALSGIVYAAVTTPSVAGTYFFIAIGVALILRPIKGVSQTLQKIGSEQGESVSAYFGLTIIFALGYLGITLGGFIIAPLRRLLIESTVFAPSLVTPVTLLAISTTSLMITQSLVAAIGYPSAGTWITATKGTLQLVILLVFDGVFTTPADLIIVVVGTRLFVTGIVIMAVRTAPAVPTRRELTRAWEFAKWSIPDQVFDRFSYNMPVYVLGVVATPAAVGIYETADRFADFGATISWRLASPLLTKVSGDASAGESAFAYLDGAVTGGTGVTFVVLGYLLAGHDLIAAIVFGGTAVSSFSTTALIVGGINIFRGFWTLSSHAMEGLGYPSVSFRTKLYGLIISVPITAFLGAQMGAAAGAIGYAVMNLVIFVYVVYYARPVLGGVPLDRPLAVKLTVGTIIAALVTTATIELLTELGSTPGVTAIIAAVITTIVFTGFLMTVSVGTREAVRRAFAIYLGDARQFTSG
jgi:hypothetical protein